MPRMKMATSLRPGYVKTQAGKLTWPKQLKGNQSGRNQRWYGKGAVSPKVISGQRNHDDTTDRHARVDLPAVCLSVHI